MMCESAELDTLRIFLWDEGRKGWLWIGLGIRRRRRGGLYICMLDTGKYTWITLSVRYIVLSSVCDFLTRSTALSTILTLQTGRGGTIYRPPIYSGLYAFTPPAFINSRSAMVAYWLLASCSLSTTAIFSSPCCCSASPIVTSSSTFPFPS